MQHHSYAVEQVQTYEKDDATVQWKNELSAVLKDRVRLGFKGPERDLICEPDLSKDLSECR